MAFTNTLISGPVQVTDSEKRDFIQQLVALPKDGEFYAKAAIDKVILKMHILFSLTEKDLDGQDPYPILALSKGLCDRAKGQRFALDHFEEIEHPILKLCWAAMLFKTKAPSPAIVNYLREALDNPQHASFLSELLGPEFPTFKDQVLRAPQ
jgi:hypothetical protein